MTYIVASSNGWFFKSKKSNAYNRLDIVNITEKEQLTEDFVRSVQPRYIFFPHWNWIVPPQIHEHYESVVFHTAPLPQGRGGSPIQNLILRGVRETSVNALRMSDQLDGGPIYAKRLISLDGTITEIFDRIAPIVEELIVAIAEAEPQPVNQCGKPSYFKRLSEKDNELLPDFSLDELYDRIRMVDGDGYPRAHIHWGAYKIEFANAKLDENELSARVWISRK